MFRFKHTDETSECHHGKVSIPTHDLQDPSGCVCYHGEDNHDKGKGIYINDKRYVRCGSTTGMVRAHVHDASTSSPSSDDFYLIKACSKCNRKWGSTMWCFKADLTKLPCACKFQTRQSSPRRTHRVGEGSPGRREGRTGSYVVRPHAEHELSPGHFCSDYEDLHYEDLVEKFGKLGINGGGGGGGSRSEQTKKQRLCWNDLKDMNMTELRDVIQEHGLDVKTSGRGRTIEAVANDIADVLGIA
eukprot:Rhum_TRINITY_DN3934_c0_g1::Rhum_TRINITY_DN3934_c0_g1_i1::g.12506::m.12506